MISQLEELKRGCEEILSEKDLVDKLERSEKTGKPLTIKVGFDPTAPDLHLGHTVVLQKMAQFQKFGHRIIFLIGDFTGLVGDPSGKSKTRPQLTREEVSTNAETYRRQVYKVLDPQKTEIRFNSEWLDKMGAHDFIRLASHANVARMLEREDFSRRYKEQQSISLHEFMYPLLQAYDSVALEADIEMGGRDQKFNLLLGRELMRDYQKEAQVCILLPLLEGLDGVQKMGKSLGNYVGVNDAPNDMYGKLMSVPDGNLKKYYELLSAKTIPEISELFRQIGSGALHPKEAKSRFAVEMVARFHSPSAADEARDHFERVVSRKEVPKDIPEFRYIVRGRAMWIPKMLFELRLVSSTSDGKRMLAQGGVKIDEEVCKDEDREVQTGQSFVVQCGKRKFAKVLIQVQ